MEALIDIRYVIETYINWNRNEAVKEMKRIKDDWLWDDFMEYLHQNYLDEVKLDILEYFFKNC